MSVTREQVVQWLTESGMSFFPNCKGDVVGEFDEAVKLITLARADLEAKVTEQHKIITALEMGLAEQAVEIESLRKDAERLDWINRFFFQSQWNGVIGSSSYTYWRIAGDYRLTASKMIGHTFRDAIDTAAAPKEKS